MVSKVAIPLWLLPLSVLVAEGLVAAVMLGAFLVLLGLNGALGVSALWVVLLVAAVLVLVLGLGLLLSVVAVFLPDVREATGVLLQAGFWLTPIVYVVDILPIWAQFWMQFNPFFWVVSGFQQALAYGEVPALATWLVPLGVGSGLLVMALWLLVRSEAALRDRL